MVELMVVVAIMTILAALAAPSFTPIIERWRVRQISESMQSTLFVARSEAMKRGGRVVIKKYEANAIEGCTSAPSSNDWDCGWYVFYDANNDGNRDKDATGDKAEPLLQSIAPPKNVKITFGEQQKLLRLDRYGLPDNLTATTTASWQMFPIKADNTSPAALRVCLALGGRVKAIKGADAC